MSLAPTKRSLQLRLLAIVLALALAWFIINPAPGPIRRERKATPPDADKHQCQAEAEVAPLSSSAFSWLRRATSSTTPVDAKGDEPFDWPEFIELD